MTARLVVVGDVLLDVDVDGRIDRLCPDAPVPVVERGTERYRPGGAGLVAVLAARAGADVVLVAATGADDAGERVGVELGAARVELVDLGLDAPTPVKERVCANGQVVVRLDRGQATGPGELGALPLSVGPLVANADAVVVADYGRGLAAHPEVRRSLHARSRSAPVVWDPHPSGAEPVPGCWLVTPNEHEAARLAEDRGRSARPLAAAVRDGRRLRERWSARGVAVTRGPHGAVLATGDAPPLVFEPSATVGGDTCGAGDRFAGAAATALAAGAVLSEAVAVAVEAATEHVALGGARAVVAAGAGAPESGRPDQLRVGGDGPGAVDGADALAPIDAVRRRGGTVVATGGCFDLLHAGHVELLRRARRLGDCLVVCLNSDASVRLLKGSGRPIVPAGDRARVLAALADVDAVVVFAGPTPAEALEQIRPDVFVKGGDYAGAPLPEQELLDRWGGTVVTVPYLAGRSTTRLRQEANRGS